MDVIKIPAVMHIYSGKAAFFAYRYNEKLSRIHKGICDDNFIFAQKNYSENSGTRQ